MRRKYLAAAIPIGLIALLALPTLAFGQDTKELQAGLDDTNGAVNTTWVIVAAILVMFMQAGFLLLEVGFSRMKNVGAGVAKVIVNFSIASLAYWAVGFAIAFGGTGSHRRRLRLVPGCRIDRSLGCQAVPAARRRPDRSGGVDVLPVRLLRRFAGDRLGDDAGADQVRRLRDLRDHLQRRPLPDDQPLDLRRRLAAGQRRVCRTSPVRRWST